MKLGRIKFKVKDMRTDSQPSAFDQNKGSSPLKQTINCEDDYELGLDDISDEFVEIDCAVVDSISSDNVCKVCWSNE